MYPVISAYHCTALFAVSRLDRLKETNLGEAASTGQGEAARVSDRLPPEGSKGTEQGHREVSTTATPFWVCSNLHFCSHSLHCDTWSAAVHEVRLTLSLLCHT